jgi:hypothetical protein
MLGHRMRLKKIDYNDLNSKQKEIYNFQKIAGELSSYGFNCIKLTDDWQGADFLAYHKDGKKTLKVQLKARLTINKKYNRKSLYIAFPINNSWYLIDHDILTKLIKKHTNWLDSDSWRQKGYYHSASPSKALIESLKKYKL